jgi:hypothetical protein
MGLIILFCLKDKDNLCPVKLVTCKLGQYTDIETEYRIPTNALTIYNNILV